MLLCCLHLPFRLTKSSICPMTNCEISIESVTTPGRLILSILSGASRLVLLYLSSDWYFLSILSQGMAWSSYFSSCAPLLHCSFHLIDHNCTYLFLFDIWVLHSHVSVPIHLCNMLLFRCIQSLKIELLRKCPHPGCLWQGHSDQFLFHTKVCPLRPKDFILVELEQVLSFRHHSTHL